MTRSILALGILVSTMLLGTRCPQPSSEEQGHATLYVLASPVGSSFVFPPPEDFQTRMQQVKDWFLEVSYGRYRVEDATESGSPGDVVGPLQVSGVFPCSDIVPTALTAASSQVDLALYENVVVVSPDPACEFNGEAISETTVWVNAVGLFGIAPAVIQHEIGHLLGLKEHSAGLRCPAGEVLDAGCDYGEYLDFIDVMGTSLFAGHYNAFQKEKLGWLDGQSIHEVTQSGTYLLMAYESASPGPKALKIRRQADSYLYLEYRTPTGFDDLGHPGYSDGAVARLVRPYYTGGTLASHLLFAPGGLYTFGPGEEFQDARGHRIEVVMKTPDGLLLDVELTETAEQEPPQASLSSFTGALPGHRGIIVEASDESGIDRVEFYAQAAGPSFFDWTRASFLASFESPDRAENFDLEVQLDVSHLTGNGSIVAAIYDNEGNVARKGAGSFTPPPPPTEPNPPPFLYAVSHDVLMTIDPSSAAGHELGGFAEDVGFQGLAFDPIGKVLYGLGLDGAVYRVDPITRNLDFITSIATSSARGLAYDSSQGILYASAFVSLSSGSQLFSINPQTMESNLVGVMEGFPIVNGLAYDPVGDILFGIDSLESEIVTINRLSGQATVFASALPEDTWFGLAFDHQRGVLLATRAGRGLTEIDPTTLVVTDLGTISDISNPSVLGLGFCPGPEATDCQ